MLRSAEYRANRFRKGGMEDIVGFGSPVSDSPRASPGRSGVNPITHETHRDFRLEDSADRLEAVPPRSPPSSGTPSESKAESASVRDDQPRARTESFTPGFGSRKGRGVYGNHSDSGADLFGRSLFQSTRVAEQTADPCGSRDSVSVADDGALAAARAPHDAYQAGGGLDLPAGLGSDALRIDVGADAEGVPCGLTSEQSNRTKFGRRRFPENDQVSRIF